MQDQARKPAPDSEKEVHCSIERYGSSNQSKAERLDKPGRRGLFEPLDAVGSQAAGAGARELAGVAEAARLCTAT
jgi:hypothetical protein